MTITCTKCPATLHEPLCASPGVSEVQRHMEMVRLALSEGWSVSEKVCPGCRGSK